MNKEMMVGVDIGGTTIKLGFISQEGEILTKWEIPTNTAEAGHFIVEDIWNAVHSKLTQLSIPKENILGIGVGAPGFIEAGTGLVYEAVNIGWKNLGLARELKERSGLPVYVQNDANIAALGENWKGAGHQANNMIAVTLGTGVGGGVIANGAILNGETGMAGEIGHIKVEPNGQKCNCGGYGCLETVSSATGIVRQALITIEANPDSALAKVMEKYGSVSSKDVIDLAERGDEPSKQIISYSMDVLGRAIANMATIINPSIILIGGGVSKAGDPLLQEVKKAFQKYAIPKLAEACEIRLAKLGNDAGIIGAGFLVLQNVNKLK
ncbi:ROK family protein [Oceanobacillus piezotolerans]|uniref:Glucokinase n=1 Tax=Oceanobacillus piezotolerans TaxID=2448030 RepID=A0A498DFV9_9BACI|nr:ROK family glucokinase [Oceanobacillus piezotolerans]RLL48078.1 ROK family protein [Oceanobacillus piezotolerans]